jgi:hypothetical protein
MMLQKGTYPSPLPSYVSYRTWQRLLSDLRDLEGALPNRIDRSLYDSLGFSGTQIATLRVALRFFGLVNVNDAPTEKLRALLRGDKEVLKRIFQEAYEQLFGELDVRTATPGQLQDYFEKAGAKGDIARKCMSFFTAIASECGTELSPSLLRRPKSGIGRKTIAAKIVAERRKSNRTAPPTNKSLPELLVRKFPDFDPSWPAAIKKKWFDDFKDLFRILAQAPEHGLFQKTRDTDKLSWPASSREG